jgi:glutamate-1-semialdehyde 2,1-aminomutase
MNKNFSQEYWSNRAKEVLPAGGFGNFDPNISLKRGLGSQVWDDDGKKYLDFLIGSGPMILGHGNEEVIEAIKEQLAEGLTFFTNNSKGIELAEEICKAVECSDMIRFVSSGGEADMYAMRLARAFTGRNKILKFEGGYHGMSADSLMSLSPEKLVNFPVAVPDSAGIPESVRDDILVAPYNDFDFFSQIMSEHGDEIAGVIVEPLQRIIPPEKGFLQHLRDQTSKYGSLLIFDEIVTGFRLAYGGAQELYGVAPDLCTLGKIIGGGLPLAAIAGKTDIMNHFDKKIVGAEKFTFQVGTLSGNPLASVAGLKTMEILRREGSYEKIRQNGTRIMKSLSQSLERNNINFQIVGDPTLFDVLFTNQSVLNYRDTKKNNANMAREFNRIVRDSGILKADAKLYTHLAITEEDLQLTDHAFNMASNALISKFSD